MAALILLADFAQPRDGEAGQDRRPAAPEAGRRWQQRIEEAVGDDAQQVGDDALLVGAGDVARDRLRIERRPDRC